MTLALTAENLAFTPDSLSGVHPGASFRIAFRNQDATVDHSVAIRKAGGSSVFTGTPITGPSSTTYSVPALAAGIYTYYCTVHPFMTGTLTVN